jgi:hypothetical protein
MRNIEQGPALLLLSLLLSVFCYGVFSQGVFFGLSLISSSQRKNYSAATWTWTGGSEQMNTHGE